MKREHGFSARFRLKTVYHCFDVSVIRQKSNVFFFLAVFASVLLAQWDFVRDWEWERESAARIS